MSKAINKERKQIIQQVVILALFCIIVIIGGRILSGNRFKMTIAMADWNAAETAEDIQISWENDRAMKVSELSVRDGKDLVLVLEPDGPGDYELNIAGKDGRTILYDELHVDPLGTTYSMQSRNFTGDNAVVGGVTLFFRGLAAIALTHFLGFRGPKLYSYEAIWACGGGIFCAVTGLNFLNIFLRRIVQADAMWMRFIYETFSLSGWIFMVITLPAVLAFSLLMIISNRREQIKACGKEAVLIPSGGQGGSEPMPEAEAMGRYLRECGIPERAILQEDQSRNTYQNMAFSKTLIV